MRHVSTAIFTARSAVTSCLQKINAAAICREIRNMNRFLTALSDRIALLYRPLFYFILGVLLCMVVLALVDLVILGHSNTKPPWDIMIALLDITIIVTSMRIIGGSCRKRVDVDPHDDFIRRRVADVDRKLGRIERSGFGAIFCAVFFCQCDNCVDRLTAMNDEIHDSDVEYDEEEQFFETSQYETIQNPVRI
jgi:hypothetical protein